jgi:hypothetical protein
MSGPKSVTATFDLNYQVRVAGGLDYASLNLALNNSASGSIVKAQAYTFLENVTFFRSAATDVVIFDGGKDSSYNNTLTGRTTINGWLRIQQGTLKVRGPLAVK